MYRPVKVIEYNHYIIQILENSRLYKYSVDLILLTAPIRVIFLLSMHHFFDSGFISGKCLSRCGAL